MSAELPAEMPEDIGTRCCTEYWDRPQEDLDPDRDPFCMFVANQLICDNLVEVGYSDAFVAEMRARQDVELVRYRTELVEEFFDYEEDVRTQPGFLRTYFPELVCWGAGAWLNRFDT